MIFFLEIGHLFNVQLSEACVFYSVFSNSIIDARVKFIVACVFSGAMDELQSLDPRRQELLEARFMGGISGSTGSTGSTSGGTKVSDSMTYNPSFLSLSLYKLKQNGSSSTYTALISVVSKWNTSGSE